MKKATACRPALLAALLVFLAAPARAQVVLYPDDSESAAPDQSNDPKALRDDRIGFTVHGSARVAADQVDVELVVEAQAEDGETAEKKHRDKLKDVQDALAALKATLEGKKDEAAKIKAKGKKKKAAGDEDSKADDDETAACEGKDPPSFTIELKEGRSSIGVGQGNQNDPNQPQEAPITIATAVILRMKGIAEVSREKLRRRLAKILDTAIDAGADSGIGGGSRPAFRFRAKDNEELRGLAQEDAMKKARVRAKRLAGLAGRELGKLSTLSESRWLLRSGSSDQVGFDAVVGKIGNNRLNNYELTVSTTEVELEVEMSFEWELGKPAQEKPEATAGTKK